MQIIEPQQVDVIALDYFMLAMEEREARSDREKIAWRVRKNEQVKRMREMVAEYGRVERGAKELDGVDWGFGVEIPAPNRIRVYQLIREEQV